MKAFLNYLKESRDELRKVKWPTRAITVQYSTIVIVSVTVATIVFGLVDFGLSKLFTQLFIKG
ncbi:MAG: preprotein translocase subunit SecE [Patescibacteria group bacterium]